MSEKRNDALYDKVYGEQLAEFAASLSAGQEGRPRPGSEAAGKEPASGFDCCACDHFHAAGSKQCACGCTESQPPLTPRDGVRPARAWAGQIRQELQAWYRRTGGRGEWFELTERIVAEATADRRAVLEMAAKVVEEASVGARRQSIAARVRSLAQQYKEGE